MRAILHLNRKGAVPYIPAIPGLDKFPGQVLHSHDFKTAEPFRNRTVLCLGASFSGLDIALFLRGVAKHVRYAMGYNVCLGQTFAIQ